MSDTFGPIPVPLVAPVNPGDAIGDPALTNILSFLKAWLVTDGAATRAWKAAAPNQAECVVGTFPYSPAQSDHTFSENQLPALFLWRDSTKNEWIAEDYNEDVSTLKLLWVYPIANQWKQSARAPFSNGIAKAIEVGLERARTPSYLVPGDVDPLAAAQGSHLLLTSNIRSLWSQGWKDVPLKIDMAKPPTGSTVGRPPDPRIYRAVELTFEMKEIFSYDLSREPFDLFNETDTTLVINGGPSQVEAITVGPDAP